MSNKYDLNIIAQDSADSIEFKPIARQQDNIQQLIQRLWLCILAGSDDMKRSPEAKLDEGEVSDLYSLLAGCNEIDDITLKSFIDLLLSNIDIYLDEEDRQLIQSYNTSITDGIVTLTVTLESGETASSTLDTNGL